MWHPSRAYLITDRLGFMLLHSVWIAALSSVGGYYLAYALDASIAGCMVVVAGALFVLAALFSPTNGFIICRIRRYRTATLSGRLP